MNQWLMLNAFDGMASETAVAVNMAQVLYIEPDQYATLENGEPCTRIVFSAHRDITVTESIGLILDLLRQRS